jgi:hypothetical protein
LTPCSLEKELIFISTASSGAFLRGKLKSEDFTMAIEFGRIEDFIALAKEGKDIHQKLN